MTEMQERIRSYKKSHFYERLMERFAINITRAEHDQLILDIEDYNPKPLRIENDGKSFHRVLIQGQEIIVLYDWEYRTLLTCYHSSWLVFEDGEWRQKRRFKSKNIRRHNKRNNFIKEGKIPFIQYN